jgi:uncharacterized membrane protein
MQKNLWRLLASFLSLTIITLILGGGGGPVYASGSLILSTSYPGLTVRPGETIKVPLEIDNKGASRSVELVTQSIPEDWSGTFLGSGKTVHQVFVKNGESQNVDYETLVPLDAKEGTYQIKLAATSGVVSDSLTLELIVSEAAQVQSKMVAQYPELQGPAGAIFSFRADLTNSSNKEQSYSLGANVPAGWEVAFKPSYEDKKIASISLEAEKNQGLDIEVKPPQNVKAGEYVIPISAVSADETIQNELKVIITGTYSLELTTPNGLLNFESTAGREKEITLVVKNTGSGDLHNVKLSARQPSNWLVNFEPEQIDLLKAEESREIKAIIKPDNKAIAGDYAVTLTASTQETSTNVDFRVIVKTSTLWGLVGVVIIGAMAYGLYHTFKVYGRR